MNIPGYRVEYWTIDGGEWTASGDRRFIKATIAPQHGQPNIKVGINSRGEITGVELVNPE
jgi:hypothetical protein